MTNTPLVSIITIFFNAERFLREAVESVLVQTYDHWELLLLDDGSSDMSTKIAQEYVSQHFPKIRYFEHSGHCNLGTGPSRNLGIRESRGEYIAFLDADDVYLPQKLERQVHLMQAQPAAAMIYGATPHWYSWTGNPNDLGRDVVRKVGVPTNSLIEPPALIPLLLRNQAQTPACCGVLVRREAAERIGGFEESFRGMFEDQVFFYKIFINAPVFIEDGSWDRYRRHPDSFTKKAARMGEYDPLGGPNPAYRKFLFWVQDYLRRQGCTDADLWSALESEFWPYRHPVAGKLVHLGRRALALSRRVGQLLEHG